MPVQPIESDADEEFIIFMAALREVAAFLKSDKCKRVVALCGAGISVSAGIPDFRSPGGMYDTLRPELLTATDIQKQIMAVDPTAVVEANMFSQNQFPYLEVSNKPCNSKILIFIGSPAFYHRYSGTKVESYKRTLVS